MRKQLKTIAAFAVTASVLLSAVSCSSSAKSGYIDNDGSKLVPEYILKIGDSSISLDEYRYYYLNVKSSFDNGDETYWDENSDKAAEVKTQTENYIKDIYAVQKLAANSNITLDSDDESNVDKQITESVETYGKDTFTEQLESSYMTESLYRDSLEKRALSNKLFDYYFKEPGEYSWTDSEYRDYLNENYYCVMHILINYVSGEGTITYDETIAKANEVYDKSVSGEDFMSLVLEYGDDANMEKYDNGYYITDGDMSDEFFTTVKSLDEGMISRPLQTTNGFYIIKRLPFTEDGITGEKDYILNGYQDESGDWHSGVYDRKFTELYSAEAEKLTVEYCDSYDLITPTTLK